MKFKLNDLQPTEVAIRLLLDSYNKNYIFMLSNQQDD